LFGHVNMMGVNQQIHGNRIENKNPEKIRKAKKTAIR